MGYGRYERYNEYYNHLVKVGLVARPVFDSSLLELGLNIFWYSALYTHGVHPTDELGGREKSISTNSRKCGEMGNARGQ